MVFPVILEICSDYFPKQHKSYGACNVGAAYIV
jgi:hypothetical protein